MELVILQSEEPVGTGERALVKAQMRLLSLCSPVVLRRVDDPKRLAHPRVMRAHNKTNPKKDWHISERYQHGYSKSLQRFISR